MLFSERYASLLSVGENDFCSDISHADKDSLVRVMCKFDEPAKIYPNRYDSFDITTSTLQIVVRDFAERVGNCAFTFEYTAHGNVRYDNFNTLPTAYLWDLIELQYAELSQGEKPEFLSEINDVLTRRELPWLLCEGRIIRIDAMQFESDLKAHAIELLEEIKSCEPIFQAAYGEFLSALEYFAKEDYMSAVSNAEKSYESVLKVILGVGRGNADKLTREYITKNGSTLPTTMNSEGFREKVMMSLPFIRNNSSSDHGAGATPVTISKPLANLSLNLAAALNTYLILEYQAMKAASGSEEIVSSQGEEDELPF